MTPADFSTYRKALGLSQSQAAEVLGYGSNTRISEIEAGRRSPSDAVVKLLRAYLDGYRPRDWPV